MENASAGLGGLTGPFLWACVFPFALLIAWLAFRSIVRWKSRQYLVSSRPKTVGTSVYSRIFNPIRRSMGIRPLRVIPHVDDAHRSEVEMLERADRLLREVRAALKHSPMSAPRRSSLERQAREVPENLVKAMWTLARLRRVDDSLDPRFDREGQNRREIAEMQDMLVAEITHSVEVLSNIPVSLMKVELARSEGSVDKVLAELDEANKRLLDLSASFVEVKQWGQPTP